MTPWVTRLLLANCVMYLVTAASPGVSTGLMLVPVLIFLRPWTLVTYMFLHGSFWHLAFNMLGLYFFGPRLEMLLGSKKFITLYFIGGICGGLLSFVFAPNSPIIGASAAIFSIFYGFAYYWPREQLYIWGILPVEARWMVVGMTLLSLFGGFTGFEQGIAHFAHLGGFAGGFLYIRWMRQRSFARAVEKSQPVQKPDESKLKIWHQIPRDRLHPVNREEFDRIMTKIEKSGVASLTSEEITFLDRFSGLI